MLDLETNILVECFSVVSTTAPSYLGCYYWNNGGSNMAEDLITNRMMTPTVCTVACKTFGLVY